MKGVIKLQWQHVATANGLAESRSLGGSSPGKGFVLLVVLAGQRESLFPGQAPSHFCHAQRKLLGLPGAGMPEGTVPGSKVKTETFH